jgi:hypothetical protein
MESHVLRDRLEALRQQTLIRREVVATLQRRSAELRGESDQLMGRERGRADAQPEPPTPAG